MKEPRKNDEKFDFPPLEQGLLIECIHCKVLYPELDSSDCHWCQGAGQYFQPARMMSPELSQQVLLQQLIEYCRDWGSFLINHESSLDDAMKENLRKKSLNLLQNILIYNFDLKESLIQLIRTLDSSLQSSS